MLPGFGIAPSLLQKCLPLAIVLLLHGLHAPIARSATPLDARELSSAVEAGLSRVTEFDFLKSEAQRLGVRVWLFGGTAAPSLTT